MDQIGSQANQSMYTLGDSVICQSQIVDWIKQQTIKTNRYYTIGQIVTSDKSLFVNGVRFGCIPDLMINKVRDGKCNIMIYDWYYQIDQIDHNMYLVKYSCNR
jgi:hypothetical protein